jgi:precorrin-3B synthase
VSDPALIRGWCPSLLRPMESGDGWLARIRPQRGRLPSALLRVVAEAALRHGNGILEITNRGNLQVRGLRPETISPFTMAMDAAGAAAGEGTRILISPLAGADAVLLADEIDRALPEGLPAKFGILLDDGGALPLTGVALDVTIRCAGEGWVVNGTPVPRGEVARHVARIAPGLPRVSERGAPYPLGAHAGFLLVAPAFGQMRAEALIALAGLAATHGDGALRPTPWKSIALAGVASDQAAVVLRGAEKLGFITNPEDGRLSIVTCPGAPACARGEIATHDAASALATFRRAGDGLLHLSGCVKGCAHPGAAPVTLVGRAGEFDLVRHGKAADTPAFLGLSLAEIPNLMQSLPA